MRIEIDHDALRPFIAAVVQETLAAAASDKARLANGRLAYLESEAPSVIGVSKHVLRDARLRGELVGMKLGNKIAYSRSELLAWLVRQRIG